MLRKTLTLPLNKGKIFLLYISSFHETGKKYEASFSYLPVVSVSLCQPTGPPMIALHPSPHPSSTSASLQSCIRVSLEGVGRRLSGASSRAVRKLQWWGVHPTICKRIFLMVYLLISDVSERLQFSCIT